MMTDPSRPSPAGFPVRRIVLALVLGVLNTFIVAAAISISGGRPSPDFVCAVPGGSPYCSTLIAWGSSPGRVYAHFDPGPYTIDQRRAMKPVVWSATGPFPSLSEPSGWIAALAREHAGPACDGWHAAIHAAGWPVPAMYWKWDGRG